MPRERVAQIILLIAAACLLVIAVAAFIPSNAGGDFKGCFYLVGSAVLHGKSPYTETCFYNPPWVALLFVPLALLPVGLAWRIYLVFMLLGFVFALYRMKLGVVGIAAMGLSPFILLSLYYSNIDWLVLLGATFAPAYGIWLVVLKPQMSIILIALWMWRDRRESKRKLLFTYGPVIMVCVLCVILGLWRSPAFSDLNKWSADIFPWGVPLGLFLGWLAIRRDDELLALAGAPFLTPYLAIFSWAPAILPLLKSRKWALVAVIASWIGVIAWRIFVLR
jgi:hypothetical protein